MSCPGSNIDKHLNALVVDIQQFESELRERQEHASFNIFEVAGIVNAEIRHSNIIAWLMDPNAAHGLGGRVLSALIRHAGGNPSGDLSDFAIRREAGHIDILAVSRECRLTLAVENKIWSGEHDDQLARYRRFVEKSYPGWDHLYLYLTPNDDAPESAEDAAVWSTLGYGDLAQIVGSAASGMQLEPKARMLIDDYLECIRRHIVGDDELRERCIEIYSKHKQAFDLILANLPDAAKAAHDHARKWASGLDGAYVVEECSGGKGYVRFRTNRLDERFPELDAVDSWHQERFWFYEIITRPEGDGVGCNLKFQLCFNNPRGVDLPEERLAAAEAFVDAFADGADGTFATPVYQGFFSKSVHLGESPEYADVADACGILWQDFLARESRAVERVFR